MSFIQFYSFPSLYLFLSFYVILYTFSIRYNFEMQILFGWLWFESTFNLVFISIFQQQCYIEQFPTNFDLSYTHTLSIIL